MPIKPENRARYPAAWPAIRQAILERARWRCEWPGCAAPHRAVGYWEESAYGSYFRFMPRAWREAGYKRGDVVRFSDGSEIKLLKIVLTIAHKDHTPENCDPANLAAWCQRHHLAYDQEHHKQTAYATRKANANTRELFA